MPINPVSQMMALMQRNLSKEYSTAQVSRQGTRIVIEATTKKDEYNTESAPEWVNPHVKLNSKTNRYKQVKGYYRQVEKSVSIKGFKSSLAQSSGKEIVGIAIGKSG